jgi:acyl carrier protein
MNYDIESITKSVSEILEFDFKRHGQLNDFSSLENWDSLAQLQIILLIEGALSRTLTDLEIESLNTLDSVIEILGLEH